MSDEGFPPLAGAKRKDAFDVLRAWVMRQMTDPEKQASVLAEIDALDLMRRRPVIIRGNAP